MDFVRRSLRTFTGCLLPSPNGNGSSVADAADSGTAAVSAPGAYGLKGDAFRRFAYGIGAAPRREERLV